MQKNYIILVFILEKAIEGLIFFVMFPFYIDLILNIKGNSITPTN